MAGERKVRPDCANASNPFHVCADYCLQRSPKPKLHIDGAKSPARNGGNVDPDCVNASNPFHQCADYCTKKKKESKTGISGRLTLPVLKLSPMSSSSSGRSDEGKSVQNGEWIKKEVRKIEEGMKVDPMCVHSTNPFHQCSEYCFQRNAEERKSMTLVQNGESIKKEVRKTEEGMKVDPMCVHSSDPFHQCSEYCSQRNTEERKSITLGALLARESEEELASRRNMKGEPLIRGDKKVDPRCPNSSNPFHECADYCIRKIVQSCGHGGAIADRSMGSRSGQGEGGNSDRSKGSSNIVMDQRDVDPRCVNASNPFHKCADYCFDRIHEST